MSKIWIRNTQILTMTGEKVFSGDILIRDEQIEELGVVTAEQAEGAQIIDGNHTLAMPGLINTHTHVPMTLLRSYADDMELMPWLHDKIWPVEAKFTAEHYYWGAALAAVEMLQSGTTTFSDMYFGMEEIGRVAEEAGMRANIGRTLIAASDKDGKGIEENIQLYRDFHNRAQGRIKVSFAPHAPYTCTPEYLEQIVAASEECDAGIQVHLAETKDELCQIREQYGKTPVEYLYDAGIFRRPTVAAHCVYLTDRDRELLKENRVSIAHNPSSNLKLASGIAPVALYAECGLNVSLGTDGASSNNSLNMFKEMTVCSFIQKVNRMDPTVMSAMEVLQMATVNGARALQWEQEIGTLEIGKKADIILIDTDKPHFAPWNNIASDLVYSAQGSEVKTVLVNGKVLMKDYELLTLDVEKIKAQAKRLAEAVL